MRGSRGITLIEVLASMFLLELLFALAYPLLHKGSMLHDHAETCARDLETSLRLAQDLRRDLGAATEVSIEPGGTVVVLAPSGRLRYRSQGNRVVRTLEEGGRARAYDPIASWTAVEEGRLVRVAWSSVPRGRGGALPAFHVAVSRGGP
jgi:type II secretory pathway component PulJ